MPRKLSKLISSTKQKIGLGSSGSSGSGAGVGGPSKKTSHKRQRGELGSGSQRQQLLDSGEDYDSVNDLQMDIGDDRRSPTESTKSHNLAKSPTDRSQTKSRQESSPTTNATGSDRKSNTETPSTSNYGTQGETAQSPQDGIANGTEISGFRRFFKFASTPLTSGTGYDELYTEQKDQNVSQGSWWNSGSFLLLPYAKRAQFGTWDGVFITCLIHLVGVISFLRTGWLVGNDGILVSCAVVFACLLFTTVSLLAAIGIMERCAAATSDTAAGFNGGCGAGHHQHINPEYPTTVASARANVHLLISTVLGSRIGGAISLIYCFGQAVSCALHVTGFTETFVQFCALFIERHLTAAELAAENGGVGIAKRSIDQLENSTDTTYQSSYQSTTSTILARTMARFLMIDIQVVHTSAQPSSQNYHPQTSSSSSSSDNLGANSGLNVSPATPPQQIYQLILTNYTYQLVSGIIILVLFLFSILGVRCLFRLQTILFLMLVMAIADFSVGLFETHPDYGYGEIVASKSHLLENLYPNHEPNQSNYQFWMRMFATVGVYFPSAIGVMAGVNMGSDLKTPVRSIPTGSLSAIGSSLVLHLLFIIGLGLTCTRTALLNDYSIQHHVSALGLFFLLGLYMSAISSSLGSMYTAPRIMQNLAQELHSFPLLRCFGTGRGPNKIPVNALILFTLITLAFVMLGGINVLAPIVTIPYLLTYATIEYAYFSMAMTFDIQISREKRFMAIATQLRTDSPDGCSSGGMSRSTTVVISNDPNNKSIGGGTIDGDSTSITLVKIDDLGKPEEQGGGPGIAVPPSPTPSMQQHLVGYGSVQSITQHIKIKRRQSTQSSSSGSDDELGSFRSNRAINTKRTLKPETETSQKQAAKVPKPKTIRQLMAAVSDDEDDDEDEDEAKEAAEEGQEEGLSKDRSNLSKVTSKNFENQESAIFRFNTNAGIVGSSHSLMMAPSGGGDQKQQPEYYNEDNEPNAVRERLLEPDPELAEIGCKEETWYLMAINRWIVLAAACLKLALMFFVAWHYALITGAMFLGLYLLIGKTNPGYYPGVSEFVLFHWIRNLWNQLTGCGSAKGGANGGGANLVASFSYDRIVLPPTSLPNLNYQSDQLTSANSDYSGRQPFHHSTTINPQFANQ